MKLSDFEKEISSLILQPIHLPNEQEIDLSVDDIQYIPPRVRIEKEISEKLCPKYQKFIKEDPKDWLEERKKMFEEKGILNYSTMTDEIDNCTLKSVGKKKYPFEFFNKPSLKEVNYIKCKKPRIEENPEKKRDLVLSIAIYSNEKKGIKSASFLVLGSQTLDALADAIYCYNNFSVDMHCNVKNSSYFFIENSFYNKGMISDEDRAILANEDQQLQRELQQAENQQGEMSEKARDLTLQKSKRRVEIFEMLVQYQEPITWLRNKNRNVNYNALPMETTHFGDLSLKIGVQYLYCHNSCEHVLVVENVRGFNATIDNYDSFPVLFYQNKVRRLKCFVCKYLPGRIVTSNDDATCENPCLFCDVCFSMLHPDDGNLPPEQKSYEKHPYFLDK
jgi:snRNA-activating protein complex subunit 3